jgi:hypothetical protein
MCNSYWLPRQRCSTPALEYIKIFGCGVG